MLKLVHNDINSSKNEGQHWCVASEIDIDMNDIVQKKLPFVDYVTVPPWLPLVIIITPAHIMAIPVF